MVRYVLTIFEGSYEELKLNDKVICSISRTPVHQSGKRIVSIRADAKYVCEYEIDLTVQPGQEHCVVDALGGEVAKSVIDANFEEVLIFGGEKFQIKNDRENHTISFVNGDRVFGVIRDYSCKEECEVLINRTQLKGESAELFACIIAAYPSFRITW